MRSLKPAPLFSLLRRTEGYNAFRTSRCNALCRPNNSRTLIAAPSPNSGPLMSRRSDRALPSIKPAWRVWAKTFPVFAVLITISALGIFNYQKSSSSIVAATLYALRTSEIGRRELGDEIYFRDMWPWIWGEMNQLHGRVNITFGVKGTRGRGVMRFRSERKGRMGKVSKPSRTAESLTHILTTNTSLRRRNGAWRLKTGG